MYREAPERAERAERVVSTDELTGVQALERKHPGWPPAPGHIERREFEYVRHRTLSFILNCDVATGQVVAPSVGPSRTEVDFLAHVQQTSATDPAAVRWHFVVDNRDIHRDIHRSESLVRFVAEQSGLDLDLGVKGKSGILASRHSRAAFLSDPSHRIVFHYRHPRPQAAPPRLLHLARRPARPGAGLYRLLQSHHGPPLPLDLSRQGLRRLNHRIISAALY